MNQYPLNILYINQDQIDINCLLKCLLLKHTIGAYEWGTVGIEK